MYNFDVVPNRRGTNCIKWCPSRSSVPATAAPCPARPTMRSKRSPPFLSFDPNPLHKKAPHRGGLLFLSIQKGCRPEPDSSLAYLPLFCDYSDFHRTGITSLPRRQHRSVSIPVRPCGGWDSGCNTTPERGRRAVPPPAYARRPHLRGFRKCPDNNSSF